MAEFGEMVILYNLLPELAAKLEEACSKAVRKAAFDIQGQAQATAPVATGFLKNSIYTVIGNVSSYAEIEVPPDGAELLPEVEHHKTMQEATVAVGANYGIFVEYGTTRGPAQPYLTPAVETVRPAFIAALSSLEGKMEASAE